MSRLPGIDRGIDPPGWRGAPEHVAATTWHGRSGAVRNAFRYGVDFVLVDPGVTGPAVSGGPVLMSRNRFNLAAVHDRDHGGAPGRGRGLAWAREVLAERGLAGDVRILLLTQPRFLGYGFNPVSFWLAWRDAGLVAVIAEVNNTYGDRHSYLCHRPGFAPITARDVLTATKVFHVSPFQDVAGHYDFCFDIRPDRLAIRIVHGNGPERLAATLTGARRPATSAGLLAATLRRPAGALRTLALIHWQALRLAWKGARFRARPVPPTDEIT